MENEYRAYREVIAAGIGALRQNAEVKTVGLDVLEEELARFAPQVVVCSRPEATEVEGRFAWVELPLDPTLPMKVRRAARHSESADPTLEALLTVVDEAEGLAGPKRLPGGKRPDPSSAYGGNE